MSLLLELYDYRIITVALVGGTGQQRSWATAVTQGFYNYQTEPNPNPPPNTRRKAVNGFDTWLDDVGRTFPLLNMPLSLPTQAVMRNQVTNTTSGEVYDADQIVTYPAGPKVTIKWVADPNAPGHSDFAATTFTPGVPGVSVPSWEIQVKNTLGTAAMDPLYSGQDFYQECIAHEFGHIVTRVVMMRLGEEEAIARFRELFRAPTAPWETGPWEGRLEEAVAEFFKDMIWPTRRYDSRTQLKLPRANFEAWKDVMVDRAITAPEEQVQYQTRSAWQFPFVGGSDHIWTGGIGAPTTDGKTPGDWYTYYAYNLDGEFSYDGSEGGFLIPTYGVGLDNGVRKGDSNAYIQWSPRAVGSRQERPVVLPRDPLEVHVLQRQMLGAGYEQQGLDYSDYDDVDIAVYAEWYVWDTAVDPAPTNVAQAISRTLLGRVISGDDALYFASPPAVSLRPNEILRFGVFVDGIFPNFYLFGNANAFPNHLNIWVAVPWRYDDDLIEQEPAWCDPRWPYYGLIPSEVTAYPADPGYRRRLERIV